MTTALAEKLRLIGKSLTHAAESGDIAAVAKWATRALELAAPKPTARISVSGTAAPVAIVDMFGFFKPFESDTPYLVGGSPANPDGVTFTPSNAIDWWQRVFAEGLNVSHVRSTLLPGSFVLTPAGLAAARELAVESTVFAPEDFNPLGLEIVP